MIYLKGSLVSVKAGSSSRGESRRIKGHRALATVADWDEERGYLLHFLDGPAYYGKVTGGWFHEGEMRKAHEAART